MFPQEPTAIGCNADQFDHSDGGSMSTLRRNMMNISQKGGRGITSTNHNQNSVAKAEKTQANMYGMIGGDEFLL